MVCWGLLAFGNIDSILSQLGTVTEVSPGGANVCVIRNNAAAPVYCWGNNPVGDIRDVPSSLTSATDVSVGGNHACAVTGAGAIVCWGFDVFGQATPPPGLTSVTQVSPLSLGCA